MCWDLQLNIESYVLRFCIREHDIMYIYGLFECFTYMLELEMVRMLSVSLIYYDGNGVLKWWSVGNNY